MDIYDEKAPQYLANKRFFTEFLDQDDEEGLYAQKVRSMLRAGSTRLIVNLNDLRAFDVEMSQKLLLRPMEFVAPWHAALKDFVRALPSDEAAKVDMNAEFSVGFEGAFGSYKHSPRSLMAGQLGNLVCLEGIATRCSIVRPKVVRTVHYCEATGVHTEARYHDATSLHGVPTSSVYPTKDENDNPLTTEFGLSEYIDHQSLAVQEMPERAPAGLLPRSVDVILDGDLVDSCKPGDRVQIIGIYRALSKAGNGENLGFFKTVLIANNVRPIGTTTATSQLTELDIKHIRSVAKRKDHFELLAKSVAPSIYGHEFIKKSMVLLLLGGVEKNLANGTHIRGDINMMMVGDPSTAKSQILRYILNIAPLAINTTGRGSSGVGLTAAVTQDKETGERRLEAGAMVLADRGVVCIDEFDKMSDNDRVAIHEVMEQQTVTIAKAGIHMSLNARCSVVAAANPVYGQYDTSLAPHQNVAMPDSLLSRFDLLFIVLDTPDPDVDRMISDKVLSNHRYKARGPRKDPFAEDELAEEDEETPMFIKYDKLLHSGMKKTAHKGGRVDLLTIPFLKKYFEFAKSAYKPKLSADAAKFVGQAYAQLRGREEASALPITARCLETLIRLSCAHAKSRLSKTVTVEDCEVALGVIRFALENDTQQVDDEGDEGDDDDDDEDDDDMDEGVAVNGSASEASSGSSQSSGVRLSRKRDREKGGKQGASAAAQASPRKSPARRRRQVVVSDDEEEEDEEEEEEVVAPSPSKKAKKKSPAKKKGKSPAKKGKKAAPARFKAFQKALVSYMASKRVYECQASELREAVNAKNPAGGDFDEAEVEAIILEMQDKNKVMYRDGTVHRI